MKQKEIFYKEQIASLKNALHHAESQIDDMKEDNQSVFSDASTVKIYEKDPAAILSFSKASIIISFLKDKYEEICQRYNEKADYSHKDFTLEEIDNFMKQENPNPRIESENKLSKQILKEHNLFDNQDTENFSENVAKGLQR